MPIAGTSHSRRLLASIHDVGPRFEREVDQLVDRLSHHLAGPRFAMLVVPDHWGQAPLAQARAFQAKLRVWASSGVEMFVHGWTHRDDSGSAGFKAKHMTAGEGEFLGLSQNEALRRMTEGRALIEDIIGRPVAGFIAPAWLYGPGARAALGQVGFALAEDHMRVWRPSDGAVLAKGPVVTWASRSPARVASSLAFAALARTALKPLRTLRIAVHPGDTGVPALLDSIDASLAVAVRDRTVGRYTDLLKRN
ncbi:polysaccharide deacetylase family protein [Sphingomonas abietis]|uniref:Polysaccharide deacetylase family protein n=1 Tax=Sphingomonas abietis TaxID=3012344 RepID=A0ABY7NPP6_9SPHN|nr:polysaccharide deacetylase family protein [Sphingomonas abietis]WBO23177.1 polysaccharide deacetylase family protein [Sphingomonas abietis]